MRWQMKLMVAAVLGLGLVVLTADTRGQFGGFGGLGQPKAPMTPSTLITNESVKKELRLTDEQVAKIPDAFMKALGEVLDADQMKRFTQINLQLKGTKAFAEPAVQASLKMNDEQKDAVKLIMSDSEKEQASINDQIAAATKGGGGGKFDFKGMQEKLVKITTDAKERCANVLTVEQKRAWQEMLGDDFKLETPKIDFGKGKGK